MESVIVMATSFLKKIAALEAKAKDCSGSRLSRGMSYMWKNSSTTTSSPVVEKPILIVARGQSGRDIQSYVVTVPSIAAAGLRNKILVGNLDRAPRLNPIWKSWSLDRCTFALIGSTLYSVGGGGGGEIKNHPSSLAYAANLDLGGCPNPNPNPPSSSKQWNEIAEMHCERTDAKEVVVDEKLYVFGGIYPLQSECANGTHQPSPWAEVYDSKQKLWTALTEPPKYLCHNRMFAVYDHSLCKEKILLGGHSPLLRALVLLAYNVVTDTWETIRDYNFRFFPTEARPVFYDSKLYWISDMFSVYDLHLNQMFEGHIRGYFDTIILPVRSTFQSAFHIVGDEFGVIWLGTDVFPHRGQQQICCTTIRISVTIDKTGSIDSVEGQSLFTRCYPVNQSIHSLVVLPLDGTSLTTRDDAGEKKLEERSSGEISFDDAGLQ